MIARLKSSFQLRIAAFLLFLPALAPAIDLPNSVEVSPDNSERLGVKVRIYHAARDWVKISYPHIVDEVWRAEKAEIHVRKGQGRVIFTTTTKLGLNDSPLVEFWLDDQEGTYDATVMIHYACTPPGDEQCRGFQELVYHIVSIADYPKSRRVDFSRTPEGIAPTKESTDR